MALILGLYDAFEDAMKHVHRQPPAPRASKFGGAMKSAWPKVRDHVWFGRLLAGGELPCDMVVGPEGFTAQRFARAWMCAGGSLPAA